jgi:type I restriction enzyme S subunit
MRILKFLGVPPEDEVWSSEIAYILLMADRRIAAGEQRKSALQALFKTMLHRLMTGRIRV